MACSDVHKTSRSRGSIVVTMYDSIRQEQWSDYEDVVRALSAFVAWQLFGTMVAEVTLTVPGEPSRSGQRAPPRTVIKLFSFVDPPGSASPARRWR